MSGSIGSTDRVVTPDTAVRAVVRAELQDILSGIRLSEMTTTEMISFVTLLRPVYARVMVFESRAALQLVPRPQRRQG